MKWPKTKKLRQGFDAFVMEVADPLFRSGYLMTADTGETEDLLQETFLRVARHWTRVRSMEYPHAYARRILVNLALDGAPARARRSQELQDPDDVPQVIDRASVRVLSGIDDQAEFKWALATLPSRQRAVLVLRYWDGLSEREVAEILGCPIGTVKSSASRGVTELRRVLGRGTTGTPASSSSDIDEEESPC
jgi:RNA polymerase sigma-70 factor (sigma-E family)